MADSIDRGEKTGISLAGLVARRSSAVWALLTLLLTLVSIAAFSMACGGDDPTATPAPTVAPTSAPTVASPPPPAPTPTPAPMPEPEPMNEDDALTRAYVEKAIAYYEANGLEATVAYYNSPESFEGERLLMMAEPVEAGGTLVTVLTWPLQLAVVGATAPITELPFITEEGLWSDGQSLTNPVTGQREPARVFSILHDGLVFTSAHFVLRENVEDATKSYVNKAIDLYDSEGLDAVISRYNSRDSMEGQFYLFLVGADDNYLAHPIFPHLIGTDLKNVEGSDGQELGKEIAQATGEGIWVEYRWPNPVSNREEPKVTWAIRHDGLIFASGYYTGEADTGPPPWHGVDLEQYTIGYVNRAIERYETDGLESLKAYYNSVGSFEGEWYLFATDENDIYIVHPLVPHLIGTDIKDVVGKDLEGNDYELGKAIAEATTEGIWVDYMWLHPAILKDAPKSAYAVRHNGMIFASGYYPVTDDPEGYTQEYVRKAIERYEKDGLEATVAHYNSEASIEGQWYLVITDEDGIFLTHPILPHLIGVTAPTVPGYLAAIDAGEWHEAPWGLSSRATGEVTRRAWGQKHEDLYFWSGYFVER